MDEPLGELTGPGDFLPESLLYIYLFGDEPIWLKDCCFLVFSGDDGYFLLALSGDEGFGATIEGFLPSLNLAELVDTPLSLGVLKSLTDFSSSIS